MEQNSKKVFHLIMSLLIVSLLVTIMSTHLQAAEKPLTNEDVIKLSKIGLGEDVIISKIMQSNEVGFNLDTDSLIKLKDEGVGPKVISAMLNREKELTSKAGEPPALKEGNVPYGLPPGLEKKEITLSTKDGNMKLMTIKGNFYTSGFAFVRVYTYTYPGIKARIRTRDQSPTLLFASEDDIRAEIYIVKLEKDEKEQLRILRVGMGNNYSYHSGFMPDKDLTIPYEINEEKAGLWRIKFKGNLQPGEYGVYGINSMLGPAFYDFGID
jgi:hypothetical protein